VISECACSGVSQFSVARVEAAADDELWRCWLEWLSDRVTE
jgi:hypothetical protein